MPGYFLVPFAQTDVLRIVESLYYTASAVLGLFWRFDEREKVVKAEDGAGPTFEKTPFVMWDIAKKARDEICKEGMKSLEFEEFN